MTSDPDESQTGELNFRSGDALETTDGVTAEVFDDVEAYFAEEAPDRAFGGPPSRSAIESAFFDLGPLEEYDIVEQYWVNEPFAYTTVLFDESEEKRRYQFFEPVLTDFEQYVRQDLEQTIRHTLREQDPETLADAGEFEATLEEIVTDHAATVDDTSLHKIFYYLQRDFVEYDQIDPLMQDPNIEDISCDGTDVPVFVHHKRYDVLESNLSLGQDDLDSLVFSLAQRSNKHVSASKPQTSGNLPDGSRVQLTLNSDISMRGSNFTIRKFEEEPFTPVDLVQMGTFSLEEMAYIWLAIENNMSIMFVGPTASGKTTSMNAVSLFLPPDGKVVSIEEVRELSIPHDNWISYVTREARESAIREEITMYDLLQSALHERPQYILVGEIRTNPVVARTFFQSIFTGHPGATTFHASSARNAINRLTSDPLDVTEQMASALDLIAVQHQVTMDDTDVRPRRNLNLSEVRSDDDGRTDLVDLYNWDPTADTIDQSMDYLQNSEVLQQISERRGKDIEETLDEIEKRREILSYMVESDINDYQEVIATVFQFYRNPTRVLEGVRAGTFEPPSSAADVL